MPAHRNITSNKKDRVSCTCRSKTAVRCTCRISQRKCKSDYDDIGASSSRKGAYVQRDRWFGTHENPPPNGPSEGTMSSFPVNPDAEEPAETAHEADSSVNLSFTPTVPIQEQPAVGRARRRRRPRSIPSYSPPSHPPPLSPFSSSSPLSPAYDDNWLMPSPQRPMVFPAVGEYPSHYPSTPQRSPGTLPPSSMVSNSPVPPVTYPSMSMWHSNQYTSSYYASTDSDTISMSSSPFNHSQGSFGSDSIGSQNPSPAALPASSFSSDSPASRPYLFLNEGNTIEQPSAAVDPLGDFSATQVSQGVFSYEDEHHPYYLSYGSSLRHAVDPDAVVLGNTSAHHRWGSWSDPEPSALFRPPNA